MINRVSRTPNLIRLLMLPAAALLCSAALAQEAASRFSAAATVSLGWEDNIALIADEGDKIDAMVTRADVAFSYQLVQNRDLELDASVTPFYAWVSDVGDLSNWGATFGAELRGAFGPDFTAPWYSAGLDYTVARFDDSEPRDGEWVELELALGKRFTPLFGISGGYRYQQRWQNDSDPECVTGGCAPQFNWLIDEVFDLDRNGVFAHVDLQPSPETTLFAEYSFYNGDVAVAGRTAVPDVAVVDDLALEGFDPEPGQACAAALVPVSGQAPCIARVWRSEADQNVIELGASHRFSDRLSAEISAFYLWTTDVDNEISEDDYENTAISLSLTLVL